MGSVDREKFRISSCVKVIPPIITLKILAAYYYTVKSECTEKSSKISKSWPQLKT